MASRPTERKILEVVGCVFEAQVFEKPGCAPREHEFAFLLRNLRRRGRLHFSVLALEVARLRRGLAARCAEGGRRPLHA